MLILALDSTAQVGSVALCEDEKLIAEYTINTGHTHSETLLPMVESVLKIAGYTVDDVDLFVCTAGPGSFTGVRIGAATVKGMAFGKEKPCIGVSTLEALALNGVALEGILCPAMNARRQQVYNALFACDGFELTRLCEDRPLAITDLGAELQEQYPDRPVYLMGDGAKLVYDALSETLGGRLRMLPERLLHQSGYNTALAGLRLYRQGVRTTDAELMPVYLRPSQAERMRMEKGI
ncbi:MAG: tRNA (adenosine(37)-N6)-threonylcarbamoyltransferase complex dimerization subunit type 1 TsaB [Ruminococcaceae bacterium]|nr:tRNA (adenosine(37)-N6)-threonylcarbamoyltransferase complex dimerization subunit type 1 TsaB [Oscillospiraceae bacterium]